MNMSRTETKKKQTARDGHQTLMRRDRNISHDLGEIEIGGNDEDVWKRRILM
jgi:hypothetical protein